MQIEESGKIAKTSSDKATSAEVFFFFFINLQPLKKLSTTNYAPFALDKGPGSLTDIPDPEP